MITCGLHFQHASGIIHRRVALILVEMRAQMHMITLRQDP